MPGLKGAGLAWALRPTCRPPPCPSIAQSKRIKTAAIVPQYPDRRGLSVPHQAAPRARHRRDGRGLELERDGSRQRRRGDGTPRRGAVARRATLALLPRLTPIRRLPTSTLMRRIRCHWGIGGGLTLLQSKCASCHNHLCHGAPRLNGPGAAFKFPLPSLMDGVTAKPCLNGHRKPLLNGDNSKSAPNWQTSNSDSE